MVESQSIRLEVRDLQVSMNERSTDVVDEINFSVRAGEIFGLVGESGSGKTTLALALLGYTRRGLKISAGSIYLDGVDILGLGESELREIRGSRIAYVPQDPAAALNPTLRIGHQIRELFHAHPNAIDDINARTDEVLREVNLDPASGILRRYPHQLSGGQQQRVALAMAFACRASVIVLDEPTTGLDVSTQRHVLETVKSLCVTHGVAAVYVSHDLAVVGGLVSQVGVMYAGRLVEIGSTSGVFSTPRHPYSRGLLNAVPSADRSEILVGIPGQPPRPGYRPTGCSFAPRCSDVLDRCLTEDPSPTDVQGTLVRCHRVAEQAPCAISARRSRPDMHISDAMHRLEVRDLSSSYGSAKVLHNVSLDVRATACTAIVGESGSGKTTLARCIVGLHGSYTGTVRLDGVELSNTARKRNRQQLQEIQYIFQNPFTSLNPRKTIGQILSQPLEHFLRLTSKERTERIAKALDEVSLGGGISERFPDELSGGERQRVAIARAIIVEPKLLVCDEVTSALDVSVQAVIVELLRSLQEVRKLSMLFITHNLALVRSIAQDVVVLSGGKVIEAGDVEEVLERPQNPYTVRLMRDIPKLTPSSSTLPM